MIVECDRVSNNLGPRSLTFSPRLSCGVVFIPSVPRLPPQLVDRSGRSLHPKPVPRAQLLFLIGPGWPCLSRLLALLYYVAVLSGRALRLGKTTYPLRYPFLSHPTSHFLNCFYMIIFFHNIPLWGVDPSCLGTFEDACTTGRAAFLFLPPGSGVKRGRWARIINDQSRLFSFPRFVHQANRQA